MHRKTGISNGILPWVLVFSIQVAPLRGQPLNAGIFAGVNASQVTGDTYTGFNKLGPTAGFFLNRLIEYNIFWQGEIKYGIRGVYQGPAENDPTLYRSTYHVLELPLSVHYVYEKRIMVEVGTSPELLLAARFRDENGVMDPSTYPENRRLGLNVFAGLGYWFNENIMSGLRYTNSAIPFRDPQEWNHPRYRGYFHNVISLTVAYRFSSR